MGYYSNDTTQMKPPSPLRSFMVNDIVRLARGWTPMTVAHISENGILTAYYGLQTFHPDGEENPDPNKCPTAHYRRPINGFVWWDGDIIPGRNMPMPTNRRFTVNGRPELGVGTFLNTTTSGLYALEFSASQVETFDASEITEVVQFTFKTRQLHGNNTINNWCFLDPSKRVQENELLWSETDGIVKVIEVDTRANRCRQFLGKRIPLEEI